MLSKITSLLSLFNSAKKKKKSMHYCPYFIDVVPQAPWGPKEAKYPGLLAPGLCCVSYLIPTVPRTKLLDLSSCSFHCKEHACSLVWRYAHRRCSINVLHEFKHSSKLLF